MNRKITSFLKSYWLIIWCIVALFLLVSFSAYGAYMRTQNAKRVISTMGGAGNRFSSNRLDELESDNAAYKFRMIPVQGIVPNEGISRTMTICNYPQGLESAYYAFNIYYALEVELTDNVSNIPVFTNEEQALAQYYITDNAGTIHYFKKDDDSGKYQLKIENQELKGNKSSSITYTLHFPNVDTNVYMKTYADPKINNDSTQYRPDDLRPLGAMISVNSVKESQDTNWIGALIEPRITGKTVSDYDAFNYVISGSGAGTITLKWKTGMLELNPYYKENEGITANISDSDDGYVTLKFGVTAEQTKNRYSFQMYKKKGSDWSTITGFDAIANKDNADNPLIIFDFKADSQEQNQGD